MNSPLCHLCLTHLHACLLDMTTGYTITYFSLLW